jgi:hypothetical protein
MPDEGLTCGWILTLGEAFESGLVDVAGQPKVMNQSPVPPPANDCAAPANTCAIGVLVELGVRELFGVVTPRLAGAKWWRDREHGASDADLGSAGILSTDS